jgi:hypothetical protein
LSAAVSSFIPVAKSERIAVSALKADGLVTFPVFINLDKNFFNKASTVLSPLFYILSFKAFSNQSS